MRKAVSSALVASSFEDEAPEWEEDVEADEREATVAAAAPVFLSVVIRSDDFELKKPL